MRDGIFSGLLWGYFPLSLWATLKHFGNNRSSKAFHPVAKYEDQTSSEYATWFSSHWTSLCAALDFGVSIRSLTFRPEVFSFGPESQTAQPEIRSPPARDGEIEGSVPGHLEEQRLSLAKKTWGKQFWCLDNCPHCLQSMPVETCPGGSKLRKWRDWSSIQNEG